MYFRPSHTCAQVTKQMRVVHHNTPEQGGRRNDTATEINVGGEVDRKEKGPSASNEARKHYRCRLLISFFFLRVANRAETTDTDGTGERLRVCSTKTLSDEGVYLWYTYTCMWVCACWRGRVARSFHKTERKRKREARNGEARKRWHRPSTTSVNQTAIVLELDCDE